MHILRVVFLYSTVFLNFIVKLICGGKGSLGSWSGARLIEGAYYNTDVCVVYLRARTKQGRG